MGNKKHMTLEKITRSASVALFTLSLNACHEQYPLAVEQEIGKVYGQFQTACAKSASEQTLKKFTAQRDAILDRYGCKDKIVEWYCNRVCQQGDILAPINPCIYNIGEAEEKRNFQFSEIKCDKVLK